MFVRETEPVVKIETNGNTTPQQQREAIWIVAADSDNDQIQNEDANQPGPSGLQQNNEDAAEVKKPDEEDKAQ